MDFLTVDGLDSWRAILLVESLDLQRIQKLADNLEKLLEQCSVEGWGGDWVLQMVDWMDCLRAERWDIGMVAVWDWVQDKNLDYC